MKKALKIIKNVAVWSVVAIAVIMMIFTIMTATVANPNGGWVLGHKMYIVLSDSMKKTDFDAGSLIVIDDTPFFELKEGDVITFRSPSPENEGEIITHKIRKMTITENGDPAVVTYGTTKGVNDTSPVDEFHYIGKYQWNIPFVGYIMSFLKSTPGYFVCIFIPFALLIVYQGLNCIKLFRRYKAEQMAELQAERDMIAEERQKNEDMLNELKALKEQLAAQAEGTTTAETEVPSTETPLAASEGAAEEAKNTDE